MNAAGMAGAFLVGVFVALGIFCELERRREKLMRRREES